jgi:hypothetical protein
MSPLSEADEYSSWLESRRLIIAQLAATDTSIRELSTKIDRFNETAREKAIAVAKEATEGIQDLNLRVAMLELRAKLWGGVIGMISGGVATVIVDMVTREMHR